MKAITMFSFHEATVIADTKNLLVDCRATR